MAKLRLWIAAAALVVVGGGTAFAEPPPDSRVHPDRWPAVRRTAADPAIEQRVDDILSRMSLEQKVGQVIQGDIGSTTPDDVARYHLGSVLNGGSSAPGGDKFGPPSIWVKAADAYYEASMRPQGSLPAIPVIWGSDAVHGHNNIVGATLFPHNIGLGAARDPGLVRRIGQVVATEIRVTGLDWTFAPTLAVARDDRWGRTYESFGEDPAVATSYAAAYVEGLQGRRGDPDWLRGPHVVATAKHFLADGGTLDGRDRGDARLSERELVRLHARAYVAALRAGVQAVMASFSSWNGVKMHGNVDLLTGVLKQRWGFDGLVVGDWDGHAKVPGCTPGACPAALAAGLDMYMAPASWKTLYAGTLAAARDGSLPPARLDDAVRRILRVKLRAGLFDAPKPSLRPYAGHYELLGSAEHRAVAREAVGKSLVLLKDQGVLPLDPSRKLLVVGAAADSVARQSGGWTLTWQGTGTKPENFPGATTILAGIRQATQAARGTTAVSADGSFAERPDAAIVVFGERPYAEFQGDRADVLFDEDEGALAALRRLRAAGVPTVAVFLSGRPMWVNPYLNAAGAFVAAWLPGSEGGGVADALFGRRRFTGRLPMAWPATAAGRPPNSDTRGDHALFPVGYGLSAGCHGRWRELSEDSGVVLAAGPVGPLFADGRAGPGRALRIDGANDSPQTVLGAADNGSVAVRPIDRERQEDARLATWSGRSRGTLILANERPQDLSGAGPLQLVAEWRIDVPPDAPVLLELRCGPGCVARTDVTAALSAAAGRGWTRWSLPLSCLAGVDLARVTAPFALSSEGHLALAFSRLSLTPVQGNPICR